MFATCRVTALFPAALVIGACSGHARADTGVVLRHGLRRDVLGCYSLEGPRGASVSGMTFHPPAIAILDSAPAGDDAWRLQPDGSPPPGVPHMTVWSADSLTDTIRLSFTDGLTGTDFVLSARGDTLRGRAVSFGDAGPTEWDEGHVTAHRIRCPGSDTAEATSGAPAT